MDAWRVLRWELIGVGQAKLWTWGIKWELTCVCVCLCGVGGTSALISWFKGVDNKQKGWNLRLFLNLPIIASRANLKKLYLTNFWLESPHSHSQIDALDIYHPSKIPNGLEDIDEIVSRCHFLKTSINSSQINSLLALIFLINSILECT